MELEFVGAAREVTGSCHVLRVNGRTILLDCGLFQGRRAESEAKNRRLPLPVGEIDAIVLSHAHIDHAGRLPFLVASGYAGSIWCTPATRDLAAIMLADSAHIQEKDAEYLGRKRKEHVEPLYATRDAVRTIELMIGLPYSRAVEIAPGVRLTFVDAGHILGSASVVLDVDEGGRRTRLVFSGDVGRAGLPIIRDPRPPDGADALILESTYGNRDHVSVDGARERLAEVVRETAARGGRVLVPAFAVGRAQEIIYELHLLVRDGRIPPIPVFVDSPLAIDATSVFEMHPDIFDRGEEFVRRMQELFRHAQVHYTRDVEESKRINTMHGPLVVIAASGMAESGRILHHLRHGAPDPANTILIVGFQAEHTLGRRIVERRPMLRIFGDEVPLRAAVEVIDGYSAHADRGELQAWLDGLARGGRRPREIFLVHGEPDAQDAFADRLRSDGWSVRCPTPGTRVTL
jgi:metallo-beta-lactamase family protein